MLILSLSAEVVNSVEKRLALMKKLFPESPEVDAFQLLSISNQKRAQTVNKADTFDQWLEKIHIDDRKLYEKIVEVKKKFEEAHDGLGPKEKDFMNKTFSTMWTQLVNDAQRNENNVEIDEEGLFGKEKGRELLRQYKSLPERSRRAMKKKFPILSIILFISARDQKN
ncbi:unnamed protein product, partial [Mesorhabditis belari]|uniref:Uncharacterized protein n=1 Tax=Mesorhabditis belari TaxID=2138241 RepID=A0AAF3FKA9_9BILA